MKKKLFLTCFLVAILLTIGLNLSAQNTLTTFCPGYCNPTGAGSVGGTTGAFYMVANTETNGDITFSIIGTPNNSTTLFRNSGWADGFIATLTVGGDPNTGNKYFTRTISADQKKITLVRQSDIPANALIDINTIQEYQTATTGAEANLWPTIDFQFQYGTTCSFVQTPLAAPVITSIDADKKITFDAVPNSGSYMAYVYRGTAEVYSQAVASGDVINYTPTVTYDYTVNLQSISNDVLYLNSVNPTGYTWHLEAGAVVLPPSEYCSYVIGSITKDYAYMTWQTDAIGDVVISLSGYAGDVNTAFRGNGFGANLNNFKVNGNTADNYFTKSYAGDGSQNYTLTLKSGAAIIPGDKITYTNGTVEWKTTGNTNAYSNFTFSYTYGTDCNSLPTVSTNPATLSFDPTTGTQTFTVTGSKLTGDVTITPPKGLTVSPSIITPDGNKAINQLVTVTWTGGTSSGSFIQISGGGLVSAVPVLVNTTGFSSFCNKIIYQDGTATWPAYLNISLNDAKTEMTFTISPYKTDETTIWSRILNIVVNGGVANEMVTSNVLSADKTQITITFSQALQANDLVTFGNAMVWDITGTASNHNVYINALQGPYTVGQTCNLSEPATAVSPVTKQELNFYPNPANDKIIISSDVDQVVIYSIIGKLVHTSFNTKTIDVSTFAKGLYIVKVTDKLGNQKSSKLEIQ